jgi:hypothetical protein
VGSQNWICAEVDGNLPYFTSAEMPLRTDLELGSVAGLPPFFVCDGTSGLNNWIPDPPQAGFKDVSPKLPGLARDGGYEEVNASSFSAKAQTLDSFMFGHGLTRRYVGKARTGKIVGVNVVPGGPSGIRGNPNYAIRLGTWLTADYRSVEMSVSIPHGRFVERETFVPPP